MDQLADDARGKGKVGTTHNGIGPCYVDRDNRIGIRVCDFIDKEEFAKRLKETSPSRTASSSCSTTMSRST